MTQSKFIIIVAGGSGSRMKSELPKQFIELNRQPILMHTIESFQKADQHYNITVVLPQNQIKFWDRLCDNHSFKIPHKVINGGSTRYHSVLNGLNSLPNEGLVAIHDGVRPFINKDSIEATFKAAAEYGSGVLAVPSKDSIRYKSEEGNNALDRSRCYLIQTPQTFDLAKLKKAFSTTYQDNFTDDASVFEHAGNTITLVEGSYKNIKITTPEDLIIANAFIKENE